MTAAVRNADEHLAYAELRDNIACAAAQSHDRFASQLVADFDIAPTDSLAPTGAQRLENRLFGRPTTGEMLRRLLAALAVADFVFRVDAADEQFAVPVDH